MLQRQKLEPKNLFKRFLIWFLSFFGYIQHEPTQPVDEQKPYRKVPFLLSKDESLKSILQGELGWEFFLPRKTERAKKASLPNPKRKRRQADPAFIPSNDSSSEPSGEDLNFIRQCRPSQSAVSEREKDPHKEQAIKERKRSINVRRWKLTTYRFFYLFGKTADNCY